MTARSRWAVGLWLATVVFCAAILARTQFTTDLSAFLPRSPSPAQQVLVDQLRDGVVSRLILIAIEAPAEHTLASLSKRLAAALRGDERFASVDNGETATLDRDRDFLWRNRYLLSSAVAPEHFSAAQLRVALEEDLRLLGSPAGMFLRRILPNDPTGELLRLVDDLAGQSRPETREGVWFSRDGKRAVLLAQTRAAGYDIDAQEAAANAIRSAFERTLAAQPEARGPKLALTGPGIFSVSSRERIKGDATRISVAATLLIATLLLALYRSVRALILGLVPVATGALAGIAAVSLAFGSVHGITLGFGATLIGEGVDYAIYLFTQIAPGIPAHNTLNRLWPTLRLGVLTSICGFGAMLFSGFTGLAQLGLFSITGLIVAVTVTRFVLPGLLPAGFTVRAVGTLAPAVLALAARAPLLRYPALMAIVLTLGAALVRGGPLWSDDLASLSPVSAAEQKLDEQLRRDIGAPDVRHMIVLTAQTEQAALDASDALAARLAMLVQGDALEGFDSPSRYLPAIATQKARQTSIPDEAILRRNLGVALQGLPFKPDLFEPFLADAQKAKAQPLISRADLRGTRVALKVESLLVRRGETWSAMLPLRGVRDVSAIQHAVASVPQASAMLLDLKSASDELYQNYRSEIARNAALGAGAIVLLLLAALRSVRRVVEVVVPLAAAVGVTASAILLSGIPLSIFHLVGLLLVVAVGSNYSLFFERETATLEDRERTIVSLLFANVSTVIGFGLLSVSHVPLLHAIGVTVGAGAVLSLVFAAVFTSRSPPRTAAASASPMR